MCLICERTAKPPPKPVSPILKNERKSPPRVAVREICFSRRCPYRARVLILRTRGLTPLVLYLDADSTSGDYFITTLPDERLTHHQPDRNKSVIGSDSFKVAKRQRTLTTGNCEKNLCQCTTGRIAKSVRERNGPGNAARAISVKTALGPDYRRIAFRSSLTGQFPTTYRWPSFCE